MIGNMNFLFRNGKHAFLVIAANQRNELKYQKEAQNEDSVR